MAACVTIYAKLWRLNDIALMSPVCPHMKGWFSLAAHPGSQLFLVSPGAFCVAGFLLSSFPKCRTPDDFHDRTIGSYGWLATASDLATDYCVRHWRGFTMRSAFRRVATTLPLQIVSFVPHFPGALSRSRRWCRVAGHYCMACIPLYLSCANEMLTIAKMDFQVLLGFGVMIVTIIGTRSGRYL